MGVTKAPVVDFSESTNFDLAKVPVRFFESLSYLTGITAAQLRWYLPNINVIFNIKRVFWQWWKIRNISVHIGNWLSNPHHLGAVYWCAILIAHQIVMAKHGGSCVHFSGISTCGRTSRETVSHPQCPPLPTLCKISLPIYVIVRNKLLQPLTTTWYDSLVLSFLLLKI